MVKVHTTWFLLAYQAQVKTHNTNAYEGVKREGGGTLKIVLQLTCKINDTT